MTPPAAATPAQRPAALPRAPRRVSGPAPARSRRPAGAPVAPPAFGPRLAAAAKALPDHRLLDRLVRGRAWIVLIGIALIGIVAMQVSLLKLNAGIGHDVQRASVLQRENDVLRSDNSRLADGQRVQSMAARAGLIEPSPGSVRFVAGRAGSARKAASALEHPGAPIPVTTSMPISPPAAAPSSTSTRTPSNASTLAPAAATPAATTTTPAAPVPATPTPVTRAPVSTPATPTVPATGTSAGPTGQG